MLSFMQKTITREPLMLTPSELELFANHCGVIMDEPAGRTVGMSCRVGLPAVELRIIASPLSAAEGRVWDSCTFDGRSVGNRYGAIKAYARYVAGLDAWWRP